MVIGYWELVVMDLGAFGDWRIGRDWRKGGMQWIWIGIVLLLSLPSISFQSDQGTSDQSIGIETSISQEQPPRSTVSKHSSWDSFAHSFLLRLKRIVIELEINALWYKDFFFFDCFQFFL